MTSEQYQNLTPREETPSASSRLFAFYRLRPSANSSSRFYPGDGAKLHFANRDVDTLEIPGVPSGYLAAGDVVTAYYKGACVFRGEVATIVESKNRGTDATQTVTCVGPWSKMQRLVYRQQWFTGNSYSYSSRLILNQYRDGSPQNLNSELYEIANHGHTACGYSVSRADVDVSTQILPFDECRDITVADAIKRELRFFPKAVVFFDYSNETPALKIKKTNPVASVSYLASVPKSSREYVYNAHPITGVDLEIEATGTIDGVEYHQISHQTAGNTTAGNTDCLYATLQIKGASSSTTRQSFKSVTEEIPGDLNNAQWWKERHPRLANVAANAITITEANRSPARFSRISASTAGELEAAGLHCEVSKFTCKATITTTEDKEEDIYLTLNYLTTNAAGTAEHPNTYTWVTDSSAESGETVPAGLAATILAERSGILLSERLSIRLGDSLPQIGDAIVETNGTVFLQSFDIDCGSLTADLTFGIPEYLAPEDMAALLSGFRNKCTTSSSSIRKEGKPNSENTVEMGAIPPLSSSEFAPGTKAKTTITSTSANLGNSNGSVNIDTTEKAKLVISDGQNTLQMALSDIPEECSGDIKIHELKYRDEDGIIQIYHGFFCDDIDLTEIKSIKSVTTEDVNNGTKVTITFTDGTEESFTVSAKSGGGGGGGGGGGKDDEDEEPGEDEDEEPGEDEDNEDEDDESSVVTQLNGKKGSLQIVGGSKISVSTQGKVITITYDEDKEEEDEEEPNNSCPLHPGSEPGEDEDGNSGGVSAGGDFSTFEDDTDDEGGVPAGGDGDEGLSCRSFCS